MTTAARHKVMKNYRLFDKIDISFLAPFQQEVKLEEVIEEIEKKVPACLFVDVDIIYVGKFDFLDEDGVSSRYMDNAIYLNNGTYYESDLVYDITAALAESIEKKYVHLFYENDEIIKELESYWNAGEFSTENFVDAVYDFLIEDRINTKENMPLFCGTIEEIIRNG